MKLKYYMCGLGSGIILAVLVLTIAGRITSAANNVKSNTDTQETTGSVIAYTTQAATKDSEAVTAGTASSNDNAEQTQESNAESDIKKNAEDTSASTDDKTEAQADKTKEPESPVQSEKEKVSVHIDAVTVSSDIARMLEDKGIIDSADEFIQYMYDHGYSRVIQEGDFELTKSDTYENVAKILTRQ